VLRGDAQLNSAAHVPLAQSGILDTWMNQGKIIKFAGNAINCCHFLNFGRTLVLKMVKSLIVFCAASSRGTKSRVDSGLGEYMLSH